MRQLAILALIVILAVNGANAAAWNCSAITAPAMNLYVPSAACQNDTAIKSCLTTYMNCSSDAASGSCSNYMSSCTTNYLRCIESAQPQSTECSTWSAALANEKLYLAAGGDYNGSALEASCKTVVCSGIATVTNAGGSCPESAYSGVCVDVLSNMTTAAPTSGPTPVPGTAGPTEAPTRPPIGQVVAKFKITGDKAAFEALLSTAAGYERAKGLVANILARLLGVGVNEIVVVSLRAGSLEVEFYSTNQELQDSSALTTKLEAAADNVPAGTFDELAAAAGIPASELGIDKTSIVVEVETAAPAPPLTDSASAVTVAAAVAGVLFALLL